MPRLSGHVSYELLEARGGPVLGQRLRSDLEYMGYVATATLERIACDCSLSRVITRGRSQPLDVGRSTRVVPTGLWNALVAREGGCVGETCDRPPGWCDVHHRVPWHAGGPSTVSASKPSC